MAELIDKSELRRQLWERHDYIVSDYAMYADAEETADEICGVVSMLDDMPTVTEAEIRAKAIEEFAEKIKSDFTFTDYFAGMCFKDKIDEIAEQLKGE